MARTLSFSDLPAMMPDSSGVAKTGLAIGQMISDAMQNRAARRQQAEQAQQRLQLDQSVAAQNAKHDTAVLGESTRHNQALEADSIADREAQIRAAKAAAIRDGIKTAVESGGNPEVIKALNAQLAALEGDSSGSAPAVSGTAVPGSALGGFDIGHGPAQPVQSGAQSAAVPSDTPTSGGAPPAFDATAIRQSLLAPPGSLDGFTGMGSAPTINRQYRGVAQQHANTPYPSPAARLEAMHKAVAPAARDEASLINARQVSINQGGRGQSLDISRAENAARAKARDVATRSGLNMLNEQARHAEEAIALMGSGNPLAESNAFLANLRAQQGNRPTDRDLVFQLRQAGIYDRLMNAVEQAAGGGYTEEYGELFSQAAQIQLDLLTERRLRVAEAARNSVLSSASIRHWVGPEMQAEMAEEAAAAVLGELSLPTSEPSGGEGGGQSVGVKLGGQAVPDPEEESFGEEDFR